MVDLPDLTIPEDGKLSDNIAHFARALRKAGLRLGPGRVIDAVRAVEAAGFTDRRDFYWVLHACFVSRPTERAVFDQVFRLFWRDPAYLEHMMSMLLPQVRGAHDERVAAPAEKRAAEALLDGVERPCGTAAGRPRRRDRDRRADDGLGPGTAADARLRADVGGRGRRGADDGRAAVAAGAAHRIAQDEGGQGGRGP